MKTLLTALTAIRDLNKLKVTQEEDHTSYITTERKGLFYKKSTRIFKNTNEKYKLQKVLQMVHR